MDFCKLFADIEKDPRAPVKLTVGEYMDAAEHARQCKTCYERVERVALQDDGGADGIAVSMN